MKDDNKTKKQLVHELTELRSQNAGLEKTRKELAVIKIAADEVSEYAESVINTVREPLIVLNQDLRVVTASRSFYEFFKVKPTETVGQLIYDLGNKQWDIPKLRELLETILPEKATFDNYEVEHDFTGVGRRIMLLNARQIERASGKERIILLSIEDITERKKVEVALRASEENFRRSLDKSPQGVRIVSKEGETLYANRAILDIFGYDSIEELQTTPTVKRYTEQSYAAFKVRREERRLGKDNSPEYWIDIVRKDGEVRHLQVWRKRILWNGKEHYQAIYRDITDRKRTEKALEESEKRYRELSIVDDLTQLYNSRHFYHQLKMEMDRADRYGQPLTLLLFDLDDFKRFNDAYGHVEGDQVLLRLGQVVKRCLRQTDSAYRYGGEEFTILLPMATSADGAVTAERIRTEFKKETFSPAPDQDGHVTVSIGLAQYKPQEDMKAFVHRVDQLMYQGKKNGKDRVCSE